MINKTIEKEFNLITKGWVQKISDNEYKIKPYELPEIGRSYILHLDESIKNDTLLRYNWNKNTVPECEYYYCIITKKLADKICIIGTEFDISRYNIVDETKQWEGWLPSHKVRVVERIQ